MDITIDFINLEGSILGEVLDADYLAPKIGVDFAEPVNLKPTNYCTAMWNGVRCDGTHEVVWMRHGGYDDIYHSARGQNGRYNSMWRDGYGGIVLNERPYEVESEGPDFDLGWSELDRIHAEACEKRAAKAHMTARAAAYEGQLAGTFISGVLEISKSEA